MWARLAQYVKNVIHLFPAWALLCLLPDIAFAQDLKARQAARPRPVSEGMALMQPGIAGDMCSLTFDDGPSSHTGKLLDILKEYGIKATFFVVGHQVRRRPELIRRMLEEGHEVGNHSYSHNALRKQSAAAQQEDLRKLDTLLRELGASPRFVRPPYGFYDHNTVNAVQELDGHLVMWSVDSQDWRKRADIDNVLVNMRLIYTGAPLRGVFLFHDTHKPTVDNMPHILEALAATGCRFVTLAEYIDTPQTQPAQEKRAAHDRQTPEARPFAGAGVAGGAAVTGVTAAPVTHETNKPVLAPSVQAPSVQAAAVQAAVSMDAAAKPRLLDPAQAPPVSEAGKATPEVKKANIFDTMTDFFHRLFGGAPEAQKAAAL